MSHYVALVNYTDKGIANVKDSPNRLDRARSLLRPPAPLINDRRSVLAARPAPIR